MKVIEVIKTVGAEFRATDDDALNLWIDMTKPFVSEKQYGTFYPQALAYLTAHRMKMSGLGDNTYGSIADTLRVGSFNEGETAISFNTAQATNFMADGELSLTNYGLQFLGIRRMAIMPIRASGGVAFGNGPYNGGR